MAIRWIKSLTRRWLVGPADRNEDAPHKRVRVRSATRVGVEPLEDRTLVATTGVPWADARHLSISFAPDGTEIAAHQSNLFKTLDRQTPRTDWQRQILRAFQTWAVQANINLSLESDNGDPFGSPGRLQNDPRFGDIRVGAHRMSREVVSVSVPHDRLVSGTWAGDVLLNSSYSFNTPKADLFSTVLHEAGHVLGLGHSTDRQSVMFSHSGGLRTGLTQADIALIQSLYGVRAADPLESDNGNDTLDAATRLGNSSDHSGEHSGNSDGSMPLVLFGDITTLGDVDVFSLRPISNYGGPVTFRLQTAGVSLLAPRLTVLDASGRVLGQSESTRLGGSVLTVRLAQVDPRQTYYAKVEGAVSDLFGIGSYGLAVTFDAKLTVSQAAIDAVLRGPYDNLSQDAIDKLLEDPSSLFFNDDQHTDDTFITSSNLTSTPGYAANTHFEVNGSIGDRTDIDIYRIRSANARSGRALFLTGTVRAAEVNATVPRVTVFDRDQNPVDVDVLVNGNGTFVIQAANVKPGAKYFLVVQSDEATGNDTGNYTLNIDISTVAAKLGNFVTSNLSESTQKQVGTLYVAQSQLFQFSLSVGTSITAPDAGVRMVISTQDQRSRILELTAPAGDTVSGNSVFLSPGEYSVQFTAITTRATRIPQLAFKLRGGSISDPIGPTVDDPTLDPVFACPNDAAAFCYPGGITSLDPFLLLLAGVTGGSDEPANVLEETEPNGKPRSATPFDLGSDGLIQLQGSSEDALDRDYFVFSPATSGNLSFTVHPNGAGLATLEILHKGVLLAETDPNGGVNSGMLQVTAGKVYFIRLRSPSGRVTPYLVDLALT